jgi:hypothetical protein
LKAILMASHVNCLHSVNSATTATTTNNKQ